MNNNRKRRGEISITFMSGAWDGRIMVFEQPEVGEQLTLSIGRRENCSIVLTSDNQVSRVHAHVICSARPVTVTDETSLPYFMNFWLEDAGSRNGTFLEKELEPLKGRVSLRPSALFRVGRTWLRLDIPLNFAD